MTTYAGIGSRDTPPAVLRRMTELAAALAAQGWALRSGGAQGADSAFAEGAGDAATILHPDHFEPPGRAFEIAESHHPAWHRCRPYAHRLLARNACVILGPKLDEPACFVAYWNPPGARSGGTRHALRIAESYGIPALRIDAHGDLGAWLAWVEHRDPPWVQTSFQYP